MTFEEYWKGRANKSSILGCLIPDVAKMKLEAKYAWEMSAYVTTVQCIKANGATIGAFIGSLEGLKEVNDDIK